MKNLDNIKSEENEIEAPSAIVRIAYRQLSIMSGAEDPTDISKPVSTNNEDKYICTTRLCRLPIFVSLSSTISDAYTSVKKSHSTVTLIFDKTEEQLNNGAEILSPVTGKICATLEKPLTSIDSIICPCLDFMEKNVPSITLPPGEMYDNFTGYLRRIFDPAVEYYNVVSGSVLKQLPLNEESKDSATKPTNSK